MNIDKDEVISMLYGNVCRMCITDSLEELENMYDWALRRIFILREINEIRILEKKSL